MIGIIGAMDIEIEALINTLENKQTHQVGSLVFFTGILFNKEVILAICGIGKVNAALCTQTMILHFSRIIWF